MANIYNTGDSTVSYNTTESTYYKDISSFWKKNPYYEKREKYEEDKWKVYPIEPKPEPNKLIITKLKDGCYRKDWLNGEIRYYNTYGQYHREDGPALIVGNKKSWYINDKRHRVDGPASMTEDDGFSIYEWYYEGKLHRVDGPAYVEYRGDSRINVWYLNGKRHRVDGPAYVNKSIVRGIIEEWYYLNDKSISKSEFEIKKISDVSEINKIFDSIMEV